MVQEQRSRDAREAAASKELAARLDTLSTPLAERILGRAIEIQHEDDAKAASEAGQIDFDDLKEIALEVGIPEDALERALLEELETERDHDATRVEKLTAPRHVRGGTLVEGERSEVERKLREYLEQTGGFELLEQRDRQLAWRERAARTQQPVMDSMSTEQHRPGRHLLELNFDTAEGRKKARRIALIAIIAGTIFGGVLGGFAIFGGIGLGIAAGVAGAVSWLRRTARKARQHINGALDAVSSGDGRDGEERTWLDVWESQQR
ncbi:MAG TPA: hypothetical protein VLG28_13325 [Acidimicrobiia bacterium]|jgi:hypothetical protein|nr:hypothetical protein [Acidimicrobiia bacterium]